MPDPLWSWSENRFKVPLNRTLLDAIVADMEENGDALKPSDHWTLGEEYTNSMETMIGPWVGRVGCLPLSEQEKIAKLSGSPSLISDHITYLKSVDHLNLLPDDPLPYLASLGFRLTDLHSLIDLSILTAFFPHSDQGKLNVLEVGGGFGRLAEVLQLWKPGGFRHILVDAVPISLMFAVEYLNTSFPNLTVRYAEQADDFENADIDILVVPSWRTEPLKNLDVDLCVNIESFQEMDQHHVDYYLELFDTATKDNGMIYISNSRDYVFKGNITIPEHWELMFKHRTPRSWTRNHPTEVFAKRNLNCHAIKVLRDAYYEKELELFDLRLKSISGESEA